MEDNCANLIFYAMKDGAQANMTEELAYVWLEQSGRQVTVFELDFDKVNGFLLAVSKLCSSSNTVFELVGSDGSAPTDAKDLVVGVVARDSVVDMVTTLSAALEADDSVDKLSDALPADSSIDLATLRKLLIEWNKHLNIVLNLNSFAIACLVE
jgi:hypothetical protein